jgi:hypothetical protein
MQDGFKGYQIKHRQGFFIFKKYTLKSEVKIFYLFLEIAGTTMGVRISDFKTIMNKRRHISEKR